MKEKRTYGLQKAAALRFREYPDGSADLREIPAAAGSGNLVKGIMQEALGSERPVVHSEALLSMLEKSGFQSNASDEIVSAVLAVADFVSACDCREEQNRNSTRK